MTPKATFGPIAPNFKKTWKLPHKKEFRFLSHLEKN